MLLMGGEVEMWVIELLGCIFGSIFPLSPMKVVEDHSISCGRETPGLLPPVTVA